MTFAHVLGARVAGAFYTAASFGATICTSVKTEVFMTLNVVMTCLMAGVALLRRYGNGSEIRRGKAWKSETRSLRDRASKGSTPFLRLFFTNFMPFRP